MPNSVTRKPLYRPVNRTSERFFFGGMAILLCVIVVYGFSRTYFLVGMLRAPLPAPILHIHGAVFTLWMVLYLVQTAFISAHRVVWHRTLGTIAFCLPPIMIVLATIAGIDALKRGVQIGPLSPEVSLAIPLVGIAFFTVLIYGAWATRRKPDSHKRLILYATIAICDAALGRFPWGRIGVSPGTGAVAGLGLILLLPIAYDLISLHRLHRSTIWAAPLTFAVGAAAVPIGMTPLWHSFAQFLSRNIAPHL
jgi:hypothetical protein